jgi:mannan endo-1,6-alpha-mannosidase
MYTGNSTYFEWANTAYDWTTAVGLMNPSYYAVYDGANDLENCAESSFDRVQWTYNSGIYLYGAAVMWNQTTGSEQAVWEDRVWGIFNRTVSSFFLGDTGIMRETACEFEDRPPNCNVDQTTFKAYLARWLTSSAKVAPFLGGIVEGLMKRSAVAAAGSCTGGSTGTQCGMKWFEYGNDGNIPLGDGR